MNTKKLFTVSMLCVCMSAQAEFKDGNTLLNDMTGSHGNQMNALGYVTGVADALMRITYCPPYSINAGQVYDMVKQYLEQFPANRHNTADRIIGHVLKSAWPCAQRGQNL